MSVSRYLALGFGCILVAGASTARAVPALQLYVEGATYSAATETWEITTTSSDPIRLWTIANVDGPGGVGAIENVRLAIAYDAAFAPTISLTSSTTGGLGGFVDPSTPADAAFIQTVTNGDSPTLGDGSSLPNHGIYGAGTHWQEFGLGDFDLTDSPIADFIDAFPSAPGTTSGQINVYELSVLNGEAGLSLHFDLYDTIVAANHVKFAPFSHDGGSTVVPLPSVLVLASLGFGLVGVARRRIR